MDRLSFKFDGVDSKNLGIYLTGTRPYPSPERDVTLVDVLGRDGSVVIDNQRFKTVDYPIDVIVEPTQNSIWDRKTTLKTTFNAISYWLKGKPGWRDLIFSDEPNFTYQAMVVESYSLERALTYYGQGTINFKVQPYKLTNNRVTTVNVGIQGQKITVPTTKQLPVDVHIEGSGDVMILLDGFAWILIKDLDGYIDIEGDTGEVYKGQLPQYEKFTNLYEGLPYLFNGDNYISWKGNVTKLVIRYKEAVLL